jgi:hypothetical protein
MRCPTRALTVHSPCIAESAYALTSDLLTLLCHQLRHIHEVPHQGPVALIHLAEPGEAVAVLWDDQEVNWGLRGTSRTPSAQQWRREK